MFPEVSKRLQRKFFFFRSLRSRQFSTFAFNTAAQSSLGLTGHEVFDVTGIEAISSGPVPDEVTVVARADSGQREFRAVVRIDTPGEADYFRHGGIMQFVLRTLLARP